MLKIVLPFVLLPLAIGFLAPSRRGAAVTSLLGAAAAWALIARFTYLTPIPLNEPEWWGGLAIACALAGIGLLIGSYLRSHRAHPVSD